MATATEESRAQSSELEYLENVIFSVSAPPHDVAASDLVVVLLYTLMVESGFKPCESMETDENGKIIVQRLENLNQLPNGWKDDRSSVYKMTFVLGSFDEYRCRLVGFLMNDILLFNIVVPNITQSVFTTNVNCAQVVLNCQTSESIVSRYLNIPQLKHKLKCNLLYPVRCLVLNRVGIVNESLLGLPNDVKLGIFLLLHHHDLFNLSLTCHFMNDMIMSDQTLWKKLFKRDYRSCYDDILLRTDRDSINWQEAYKKRLSAARERRNIKKIRYPSFFLEECI